MSVIDKDILRGRLIYLILMQDKVPVGIIANEFSYIVSNLLVNFKQ